MTTFMTLSSLTLTGSQVILGILGVSALLLAFVVGIKSYWKTNYSSYRQAAEQLPRLSKKHRAVDLGQYSTHFKLVGLVAAIGVVFIIFAWTHYNYASFYEKDGLVLESEEYNVPVTTHDVTQKLPRLPPPSVTDKIEIVDHTPVPPEEPVAAPPVNPPTGSNDGKASPSLGQVEASPAIVIEPEPITEPVEPDIFAIVEQMPRFPGCEQEAGDNNVKKACADQKLLAYIYNNISYPTRARETGIEGIVVISFVVDRQGKIQDIKILRGLGSGLGKEALRVVKKMNQLPEAWTPGKQRGKNVKVRYNLPVRFTLR